MTIALLTLGCKLNYAETSTYERGFAAAGWIVTNSAVKADVYLVNTCSVTAVSDAKSRNLIRKLHRLNPEAPIVVTGCSAELRRSALEPIEGVRRVFSSNEKPVVVEETLALVRGENVNLCSGSRRMLQSACVNAAEETVFAAYSTGERTRSFLKVQDGCDNYCAYCTVPYARGKSRNVPLAECVRNAEAIAAEGVREIVITGVNTGDYGRSTGESFLDLLKALHSVRGIERYRISSIEPNLLTHDIIDWIASEGHKFQPHFHIPLQCGSDAILRNMGRRYDTSFFSDKIAEVRSALEGSGRPRVFFGIDLMAGLPGETDEMFSDSIAFLEGINPAFIHAFPYSRRPGTPAASMPGQVPEQVKAERMKTLEVLCSRLHSEFIESQRGSRLRVLFESREKDGMMSGYTENYIRVSRPFDPALVGTVSEIIL